MQGRFDAVLVRWTGTSGLALMLRSKVLLLETTGRRTGKRRAVLARELEGDEYAFARSRAFERWPKAPRYEERSGRRIPYFRLDTID